MIRYYEKRNRFPLRLASARPLVNYWNCRKPSDSLFAFWPFTAADDGHSLFLSGNADVGYQYVYHGVLRRCTHHFCLVLPLVVSNAASVLLRARSAGCAVLQRIFNVCNAFAFRCSRDGSLPSGPNGDYSAPRAYSPLPVVVANQKPGPLHLATSGSAGLFAFRHWFYAAAFRLAVLRGYEKRNPFPSRLAAARSVVLDTYYSTLCFRLCFARLFSTFLVRGRVGLLICRNRARRFWAFLFMVVANTASVLLCSSSNGRLFVHADFPIHHEHGAHLLHAGQWSTGTHLSDGDSRRDSSGSVLLVASDGERGSIRLVADGLDSLFAFRPLLPVALFLSKRLLTATRFPRLSGHPVPSSPFSLFPPTAAFPGLRGLSPCPSAFAFGGAA